MASQQQAFVDICNLCMGPTTASSSGPSVLRRAIDTSGRIGSLYDARYDTILDSLDNSFDTQTSLLDKAILCTVRKHDTDESPRWLKCIRMDRELRLSVALKMVPAKGMAAVAEYSRPTNKYTRFINCSYLAYKHYLSDHDSERRKRNKSSMFDAFATHVIVRVNWGIDAIIILQLPHDDQLTAAIDRSLNNICFYLNNDHTNSELLHNDQHHLEQITYTEVFSNIPDLTRITSIIDFCHDIVRFKKNLSLLKPYTYKLCPIQHFYTASNTNQDIFNELQPSLIDNIENYVVKLSLKLKNLKTAIDQDFSRCQHYLKHELRKIRAEWSDLKKMYDDEIQRLREVVINVRSGKSSQHKIGLALDRTETEEFTKSIDDFTAQLDAMEEKEHLIKDLLQKRFEYQNASDHDIQPDDNEQDIKRKLLKDSERERVICFDDNLYKEDKSQWFILHGQFIKERDANSQLRIICVDFSYCLNKLNHMIVFSPIKKNNAHEPKPMTSDSSEQSRSDDSINILLLGESGAGKSTFINAFVNYLIFNKLEHAQKKPVVLIPVSFVLTIDDDFKERLVTFGGIDTLSNEDHDHSSQSVTQHCKSYVFTLKNADKKGRKLRIIDTPGIGDVRGLAQDDINMQHILSYINNLTHLNAVCILMKPNNARLNVFLRSCFMQLFDLLGENARDKIIFCFTNARATFYGPGDTGPLLKKFLESLPVKDIPFAKENTFCFDSESFRYLVAVKNGIKFTEAQKDDYKDSWDKSSNESKRFVEYICSNKTESLILGERESMKDAQLKVSVMIRPILEAMRNILRNIVLWNTGSHTESIELKPKIIKCTTAICFTCPRQYFQAGGFWITIDSLHVFHNKCRTCGCSPNDHYSIDYQLEYKQYQHSRSNFDTEMTKMLDNLCQASAEFAHFLVGSTSTSQNDSFLTGFSRMIKEEKDICKSNPSCQLNSYLLNSLKELKKKYEEAKNKLSVEKEHIQLSQIFDKIRHVSSYPMIESQMSAVKEWRKFMIKYYEYEVPIS